jgi:hypothetical protein
MIYIDHMVEGLEMGEVASPMLHEAEPDEPTILLYLPDGSEVLDVPWRHPIGFRPPSSDEGEE